MNEEQRERARQGDGSKEAIPPDPNDEIDGILEVIPAENKTSEIDVWALRDPALIAYIETLIEEKRKRLDVIEEVISSRLAARRETIEAYMKLIALRKLMG